MFDEKLTAVAQKLVHNCREGTEFSGLDEYYAPDAVSVEAAPMPGSDSAEMQGIDAIKGKHEWWNSAYETHSTGVEGPFFHGPDKFGVIYTIDVTEKESGQRTQMKELAIYTVRDGQIAREEFFYSV